MSVLSDRDITASLKSHEAVGLSRTTASCCPETGNTRRG